MKLTPRHDGDGVKKICGYAVDDDCDGVVVVVGSVAAG